MLELLERLLATYGYLVVSLVIMAEGAGIPLPGETILLLGAAYAGAGHLDLRGVILAAALGAIAGDNLGYWIGRRGGRALLSRYGYLLHLDGRHLARAEGFYQRHGAKTVFLARFVAVLRTLSSLLAGANRMPYRRFVLWNACGGILWAVVIGSLGAAFGNQWRRLAHWIGRAGLLIALAVVAVLCAVALSRRVEAGGGWTPFLRARFSPEGLFGLRLTAGLLLVLLAGATFGGLAAYVVRHGPIPGLDRSLLPDLHPATPGALNPLMNVASFFGRPFLLMGVGLVIALYAALERRYGDALLVTLAVSGAELVNDLLKLLFARPRPAQADLDSWSFPSGHATGSMVFYGLLVYFALRAGGPLSRRAVAVAAGALAVLLIGVSRVYLGEHYPTDVLGGWAIGLVWLATVVTAVETWQRRRRALLAEDVAPG